MTDVEALLADPPRFQPRILDVRGCVDGAPAAWAWWAERTRLRLSTWDP